MGSVGFEEMMVIVVVAILIWGKQLPSIARKLGTWYGKMKRHLGDIKDEIERQIPMDELKDLKVDVNEPPPAVNVPNPPLPGPDPSDPEFKAPFDPSKGANSHSEVEAPTKKP